MNLSIFTSPEGQQKYSAAYEAMLALWPVAYESRCVATPFGSTHMLVAGPADAPPLVLLHAVTTSATQWYPNIAALSRQHRVYALDIMGDVGKSIPKRIAEHPADFADWLAEVFDSLGLDKPVVCGHSYGGWITLNLALHRQERVAAIVLLAPSAGIYPFSFKINLALHLTRLPIQLPFQQDAKAVLDMQMAKGHEIAEPFVDLMRAVVRHGRTKTIFPTVLSDDELRRIATPALLLIGEQEVLYSPCKALGRAGRLMPHLEAALIPKASHLLPMEQPELVNARITQFLGSLQAVQGIGDLRYG